MAACSVLPHLCLCHELAAVLGYPRIDNVQLGTPQAPVRIFCAEFHARSNSPKPKDGPLQDSDRQ